MKAAQQEIRSTVTVNTIDLGSKKKDDDSDLTISVPKKRGKDAPMQKYIIFKPHCTTDTMLH